MDDKAKIKIDGALKIWEVAHKKKEKYTGHLLTGETFIGHDPYEMGLAYDDEKRAWISLEIARAEAHEGIYHGKTIKYLKNEIKILDKNISAWHNRQFPSQTR